MKIALIGKGGSGKSSISWLFTKYLASTGIQVLAIDADYNMDLAHNLGIDLSKITFLKKAEADLYARFGLNIEKNAFDIAKDHDKEVFTTGDDFTKKYSIEVEKNLRLMVLGDHDSEMMYSGRCSHAYAKAIKFYLPYLLLKDNEAVISDSVAGTDMVNYGLYLGIDAIVCVVEDSKNSVGVMESSKALAKELGIPFFAVQNKDMGTELRYIPKFGIIASFAYDPALTTYEYEKVIPQNIGACKLVFQKLEQNVSIVSTISRLVEWKQKHQEFVD